MSEIKFSAEMMQAIMDGIKTVTRRPIKPQPDTTEQYLRDNAAWVERLTLSQHVNNAWRSGFIDVDCPHGEVGEIVIATNGDHWLQLEITDVRIEQIQDISIGQICKEGLARSVYEFIPVTTAFGVFEDLWGSIYGADSWDANPWVWVVEFKPLTRAAAEIGKTL